MSGDAQANSTPSSNPASPEGNGDYVVQPGECLSSIAFEHGHFPDTILNDPDNSDIKKIRKNPNILLPGDRLTIPAIRPKEESREVDQRHKFRRKGVPEMFRMRLLDAHDKPRANLPYVLTVDKASFSAATNAQGELSHPIPPNARKGKLVVGVGDDVEEIAIELGYLDPLDSVSGVQARLTNLGIECGPVDGIFGPRTRAGVERFQKQCKLEATGELDKRTLEELEKAHGS
jgi:hypothetical protein